MNFDHIMNTWNDQNPAASVAEPSRISDEIRLQIQRDERAEKLLALAAGALAFLCLTWVSFWIFQLATTGAETLREKDMMPPLGAALITPSWLGALAALLAANYFVQKSHRGFFGQSLAGCIARAKAQTSHRIFLWRAVPLALASCVAIGGASMMFSSEFAYLFNASPLFSFAILIPDLCILAFLFMRGRHLIRTRHQPRLRELEAMLSGFRPEVS